MCDGFVCTRKFFLFFYFSKHVQKAAVAHSKRKTLQIIKVFFSAKTAWTRAIPHNHSRMYYITRVTCICTSASAYALKVLVFFFVFYFVYQSCFIVFTKMKNWRYRKHATWIILYYLLSNRLICIQQTRRGTHRKYLFHCISTPRAPVL